MAEKPSILVVGSVNMDMVIRVATLPLPGQTVLGNGFVTMPGGKGANQAVAVARLGGQCRMIGRLGMDCFGKTLLENLKTEGIDCTNVIPTPDASTGVAMVVVDSRGENAIVVDSGANALLTPDDLFDREDSFRGAVAVLLQLELPLPTVRAAIDLARRNGCRIILDPAPAPKVMPMELCGVDIISPNVNEAQAITGKLAIEARVDKSVAMDLIAMGAKAAVLKLGSRGCLVVVNDSHFYAVPPYDVSVVDTTAAGDAFTAALAVAVARGEHIHHAAKFANAAGALACTKIGAQSAMPTEAEVRMLMDDQKF